MLTAIIPLDLQRRAKDLINKSIKIAEEANKYNINVIFGYNYRNAQIDNKFIKALSRHSNVIIKQTNNLSESINTSQLRNIAFDAVTTKFMILLDVDIYPDFSLFLECTKEISSGERPFIILPCLYLTKFGSEVLVKKKISTKEIKKRYFSFSRREFLHLASPSSIVIMNTDDYLRVGKFNELFTGHGYEDFDFLIRLASIYGLIDKPKDFLTDIPYRSPLFAVGFRKYLGELCIESLARKRLAFHLYHDKDGKESYYKSRKNNYHYFSEIHRDSINNNLESKITLLEIFISHCSSENKNYQDFSIFFDNKPGHIDRIDTFKRRIKFLFNI